MGGRTHYLEKVRARHSELARAYKELELITLKAVLEHVPDPMAGLREAERVLRPGGVIFLVVPDGGYIKNRLVPRTGRNFRPDARGWQHHVYFRSRSLAEACRRVGLKVAHEGRAVWREGPLWHWPAEALRWFGLAAWTLVLRITFLRRDIQAFLVKRPVEGGISRGARSKSRRGSGRGL